MSQAIDWLKCLESPPKKKKVIKVLYDYTPLNEDMIVFRDSLKVFRSVLHSAFMEWKRTNNMNNLEVLNDLYHKIQKNKKELAGWILEIQDQDVLMNVVALNDQIGLGIKEYHEFIGLNEPEKFPEPQVTPKVEEQHVESVAVVSTEITDIETPKMPWEEEDEDDLVYSKE